MRVDNLTVNVISILTNTNGVEILLVIILRYNIGIFDFVYHKVKIKFINEQFIDSSIWKIFILFEFSEKCFGKRSRYVKISCN